MLLDVFKRWENWGWPVRFLSVPSGKGERIWRLALAFLLWGRRLNLCDLDPLRKLAKGGTRWGPGEELGGEIRIHE